MQTLSLMVIENGRRCSVCSPLIAQIHLLSSPLELGKETLLTVKKKKEKEKEKDRLMLIWESISDGSQARTPVVIRKPLKERVYFTVRPWMEQEAVSCPSRARLWR